MIAIEHPIRIDQDLIFILQPDRDFSGKIKKRYHFGYPQPFQNTLASE